MVCKCSPYGENPSVNRMIEIMKELDSCVKLPIPKGIYVSKNCQEVIKSCLKWK